VNTPLPLPPRLIIDVLAARLSRGRWAAHSFALPGIIAGGVSADDAADKLLRLAEGIAGEPVRAIVTEAGDEALRERVRQIGEEA